MSLSIGQFQAQALSIDGMRSNAPVAENSSSTRVSNGSVKNDLSTLTKAGIYTGAIVASVLCPPVGIGIFLSAKHSGEDVKTHLLGFFSKGQTATGKTNPQIAAGQQSLSAAQNSYHALGPTLARIKNQVVGDNLKVSNNPEAILAQAALGVASFNNIQTSDVSALEFAIHNKNFSAMQTTATSLAKQIKDGASNFTPAEKAEAQNLVETAITLLTLKEQTEALFHTLHTQKSDGDAMPLQQLKHNLTAFIETSLTSKSSSPYQAPTEKSHVQIETGRQSLAEAQNKLGAHKPILDAIKKEYAAQGTNNVNVPNNMEAILANAEAGIHSLNAISGNGVSALKNAMHNRNVNAIGEIAHTLSQRLTQSPSSFTAEEKDQAEVLLESANALLDIHQSTTALLQSLYVTAASGKEDRAETMALIAQLKSFTQEALG